MKKKWVKGIVVGGILLTIFLALLLALPSLLPTGNIKKKIESNLSALFGGETKVEEVSFFFFPTPRFLLKNVRFHQQETLLFKAAHIRGGFSPFDFFRESITIEPNIEGLEIPDLPLLFSLKKKISTQKSAYEITSLEVLSGNLSFPRKEGQKPFRLEEISISIPRFSMETSHIEMKARDFSLRGELSFEQGGRFLNAKQMNGVFGKLPFSLSSSFCLDCEIPEYTVTFKSSAFHPENISDQETLLKTFAQKIGWTSAIPVELTLKRQGEATTLSGNFDAEQTSLAFENLLTKGAQYPLKGTFQFLLAKEKTELTEALLLFGQNEIVIRGTWSHEEEPSSLLHLTSHGSLDLVSLKPYFPFLSTIESAEEPSFSLTFQTGNTSNEDTPWLSGNIKATSATLLGRTLRALEVHVVGEKEALGFPLLKGTLFDRPFSGTGKIFLEHPRRYEVSFVLQDIDLAPFSFPFSLTGQGTLVATFATFGTTLSELKEQETLEGSLLVKEGSITSPFHASFFDAAMFQKFFGTSPSPQTLSMATKNPLAIKNLRVDFQRKKEELIIELFTFDTPSLLASGDIIIRGEEIEGKGNVAVVPKEKYILPFSFTKTEGKIVTLLDHETLTKQAQGKTKPVVITPKEQPLMTPKPIALPKVVNPPQKSAKKPAQKKEQKPGAPPSEKPKSTVIQDDEVDDLLKVIIGK